MRKTILTLMCLVAMMAAGVGLKAQEITITLDPGWNWISYPNAVAMEVDEALATFAPMEGDMVKGAYGFSVYHQGRWVGGLTHFMPGRGYMYYSTHSEVTSFVFAQPFSSVVATATPTDITAVSAVVGGVVMLSEGSHVYLRGVCWGTESNLDIDGSHTYDGTGIGMFTSTIEGLASGTTYYVRAYAVSDYGLAYGDVMSFTTLSGIPIPEVSTTEVTDITATSATCGGTVTADESLAIIARGLCWSTSSNPTINDSHTNDGTGTGSFVSTLTGLTSNTTYYVRAYATTAQATTYGEELSFTTSDGVVVTTSEPMLITAISAMCGGEVTVSDGTYILVKGLCWAAYENPTTNDDFFEEAESGVGSFSISMTDLNISTTYYVRAYAVTPNGTVYGDQKTFTTRDGIPTMTTTEVTNILGDGATCGGTVTDNGGLNVIARGVCWSTVHNPTINDSHTSDGSGLGSFISSMTGMNISTTYYVRAYATTAAGTGYGEEVSFTTQSSSVGLYVDLGLPSGTLWATCNIGAEYPEAYGDYFAWGETQPKDTYNLNNYQYSNTWDWEFPQLTKYCTKSSYGYNGFIDNLTTLLPEDDAATANWGIEWRMPTKEEYQELYNNTTVTWMTQNGVNGILFTASNGNCLFMPAAGYRVDNVLCYAGSKVFYMSSSLYTNSPDFAWILYLESGNYDLSPVGRQNGMSVRAVRCMSQNTAPTGATKGLFSVSESQLVYFSQGNLQYQASTDTWRFADNQYDYIGSDNSNISSSNSGYIDLFGWGTSGYNHGANYYQPWSVSQTDSDYYAYGNDQYDLYDQTGQADWGYNAISNGGNQENRWRTLTQEEWDYVFNTRNTASGIRYAKAKVNNVNGIILLPDNWSSTTYSLNNTNSGSVSYNTNTLTVSQWSTLEQAGAGFLPAAGVRNGTSVSGASSYGRYWSSSCSDSDNAYHVYFNDSNLYTDYTKNRCRGRSVRLVCSTPAYSIGAISNPAESGIVTGQGDYWLNDTCILTATPNEGFFFTNWTEDGEVVSTEATYTFVVNGNRNLVANFAHTIGGHGYVDLGLPRGLLWATCNVGADNPEDYGDYFAWGETTPKDTYNWSTYQYYDGSNLTKYTDSDGLTILLPEDDAATANWGSGWRMPTRAEFQELLDHTTVTWTTQNGVNGRLFTASNGNSLFLPAAGYRYDSGLGSAGSYGYYWSSSLAGDPSEAWDFGFYSGYYDMYYWDRRHGHSVRPVRSASQN